MDVVFFPRKDYDVEVCAHRLGKKMTYTEQTDTLGTTASYNGFVSLAKSRGIKVGVFAEISDFSTSRFTDAKSDYDNGNLWIDLYSRTPSLAEKIQNHETITEEEFEYAYTNEMLPAFYSALGKKPVGLSYSYGNDSFKNYVIPTFLGARNSEPSGSYDQNTYPTDYGNGYGNPNNQSYSKSRYKSKASTIRWYDAARNKGNLFTEELAIVSNKIDETLLNGGWLNNFTHWHQYWSHGNEQWAETYLDLLAQKNANDEIYFAGWGEAVAYLVYRQLITKAVMYSPKNNANNQLIIRLAAVNTIGIATDLLQVPISVKFSTANTPLEGQTIKSNRNLISLGNNQYIVEIPYSDYPVAIIEKVS